MTERLSDKNPCNDCRLYNPCTGPCGKWHEWNSSVLSKLAEYETAEEQGRLVVLPCKVGDTVYEIKTRYTECSPYGDIPNEYSCCRCEEACDSRREYVIKSYRIYMMDIVRNMISGSWGKTVFISKEAAEEALKEIRKVENRISFQYE